MWRSAAHALLLALAGQHAAAVPFVQSVLAGRLKSNIDVLMK